MQETLTISFKELRDTSNRIIDVVCEAGGFDRKEVTLSTSINDDLGIDGDDWDDILAALYQKENLSLEGLNFDDYFSDEGQISSMMALNLFLLPFRFLAYIFTLSWRHCSFASFGYIAPEKLRLTIADLVTSKIEGSFVSRKDRRFAML